ncbi:hypothetical protein HDU87_003854 [Geranomyces variabilis]|uniref:Uncharacterized protein n=1 Tax=Geranomyces variabilis TaxID=109894 RepID=A0AAD5TLK9_9FUNG|nr:hypothetical protein HDU87_003854 [Geranomyces variabilis]
MESPPRAQSGRVMRPLSSTSSSDRKQSPSPPRSPARRGRQNHTPSRSPQPQLHRQGSAAPAAAAKGRLHRQPRREAIRLTHAPVKLTTSQFDLFTTATGNTIRTGDPYARFLVGPRKVLVDVPTLNELEDEMRAAATHQGLSGLKGGGLKARGGTAGLTVGKGTKGFAKKSAKVLPVKKKYRLMRKEQFKADVFQKWDRLEDLRIQIIARMQSLKHCHSELQVLKAENVRLRDHYNKLSKSMNSRVTEILSLNSSQNDSVMAAHRERRQQRRDLQAGMAASDKAERRKLRAAENALRARQKRLLELQHEIEMLTAFQEISLTSSKLETEYAAALALQSHISERHAAAIDKVRAQDQSDRHDMENVFCARILALVDATQRDIPPLVRGVLENSMRTNERLRREIEMHADVQEEVEADVERSKAVAREIRKEAVGSRDVRRKVLTNPPDMTVLSDEL